MYAPTPILILSEPIHLPSLQLPHIPVHPNRGSGTFSYLSRGKVVREEALRLNVPPRLWYLSLLVLSKQNKFLKHPRTPPGLGLSRVMKIPLNLHSMPYVFRACVFLGNHEHRSRLNQTTNTPSGGIRSQVFKAPKCPSAPEPKPTPPASPPPKDPKPSVPEEEYQQIYFFGLIDCLQTYTTAK
eukprot:465460-Amorphochlora_amoeboformis.AAC.1